MREAFFAQSQAGWQVIVPGFGQFEGAFLIAALEYAGQHDGEASFALTLASAGEVSFVAL
jgi:TP901-1 family phage major tail protein